ncbi:MAG: hypothetical protein IJ033_01020 [Clostridia bacterium]|nr:hypothetical protein [Clostridia bacterium]
MKKFRNCGLLIVLALILALCVSVFAACTPDDGAGDTTGLDLAKEYLETQLRDAATVTGADFTRAAVLKNEHGTYTVTWTLSITSGPSTGVSLGEVTNGIQKINVDEFSSEEVVYVLTATIADENGNTQTLTYNHKVPAFVLNSYAEYKAACEANDGETIITIKGYVLGVNADPGSSSKGSLWIVDADGNGYYAYKPTLDAAITETRETINTAFPRGKEVVIKGTVTTYGGCLEYNQGCEVIATGNSVDPATLPYTDQTELFGSASSISDHETLISTQSTRAALNGVTMGQIDGYNYYFSVNGVDFICYMNIYLLSEEENATLAAKWNQGGKANLTGIINVYSNKYQLYPDSVDSIEIVNENLTDAQKVERQKNILSLEETYNDNFTLPEGTWANVAWTVEGTGATIGEANAVTLTKSSVEQTVTFTATITSGTESDTATFTVKIAAERTSFVKVALNAGTALESGATTEDSYIIVGIVSEITSAYSAQYGNVSFNVVDAEGNTLLVYRYNLEDAATIAVGNAIAIAAPIKKYNTTIEAVADFVKLNITSLADAAAAGIAGTGVADTVVYGYVKSIDTEYSSQYNNITITISDGTNDLYCYRVAGGEDIVVGEYLLITGTPSAYNGSAQMAAKATYTKSSIYIAPSTGEGEDGDDQTTGAVNTITDALAATDGTAVELSGTVSDIYEAWSSYNNMSFYLTDGTNRILVFRTGTQVNIGDVVSVSGTVTVYSNTNQIAQGSTVTITTAHVCSTYTDADCENAAECTICGTVQAGSTALGHIDEDTNGACDRCSVSMASETATATYTAGTTTNMVDGNNAATIGLDATIFTVTSTKTNGGNNHVGLNKNGTIRLYKGHTCELSISIAADYTIASIKVTLASSDAGTLVVTDGTSEITADASVYTINGSTVVLYNTNTSGQSHITSIEIVYAPVA